MSGRGGEDDAAAESVGLEGRAVRSVTAFTREVKRLLETGLGRGWVRGEVSNLRVQASGHVYFTLKDEGAQLAGVMFRGDAARQTVQLRDGGQVLVFGEVSVYEARGQYQLIVRAVVDDGVGRWQQEFEALKARLAAEGLFAAERKRVLPLLPQRIAIVTSPTGAALQDFVRILVRRGWRGHLVVYPAKVQGEGAAEEIARMIERAASSKMGSGRVTFFLEERGQVKKSITRPDPMAEVVVVGRGGGSLEDLWAFNEEVVVRAVVGCPVPVISAVGHEIDFSLCDFAADVRAETPSGAAELLSSRYAETVERVGRARANLGELVGDAVAAARERVGGLRGRLRLLSPSHAVEQGSLRRDDLANRFEAALDRTLKERRARVREAAARVAARSPQHRVEVESQRLLGLGKRLQAASPASVLQRGFAIVRDEAGRPVGRAGELRAGQAARMEFRDGEVAVTVAAKAPRTDQ